MAAADVQHRRIGVDPIDDSLHARLGLGPGVGVGLSEGLIECAINLQELFADVGAHDVILLLMGRRETWLETRRYRPEDMRLARLALEDVRAGMDVMRAVRRHPLPQGGYLGKHHLVHVYREVVRSGEWAPDTDLLRRLRMKPVRTLSGVTTVTVLTRPFPCPGECIFCPTDVRMPKSYLPDEPGAARALEHNFDPFLQTSARLEALAAIGHPVDKVELLILGGTWSAYPRAYQAEFIRRCLDAMNGFESAELAQAQAANSAARHRNVGLVIETRPDRISLEEIGWLRSLGVTKVQLGAQSLDDAILARNRRGHTVEDLRRAVGLLRAAGFKIVLHWMPNLLGSDPAADRLDFPRLWSDDGLRPDEIKIYPCQLLENSDLYPVWKRGEYHPYSTDQLVDLLADIKPTIPVYCRVNRVIRDIPSNHVVEGNRRTSLRQDVQAEMQRRGTRCRCIRCREVRGHPIDTDGLRLEATGYSAGGADEVFLELLTDDDRLAAYARLSLPSAAPPLRELAGAALLRELHVVGPSLEIGRGQGGAAQHVGLGARLLHESEGRAAARGYRRLAVISAVGTRDYYAARGYRLNGTYMVRDLAGRDAIA